MSELYFVFKDLNLTISDILRVHVQSEERPGCRAPTELSDAARRELMEQCEEQFAQLEKVKSRLNVTENTDQFQDARTRTNCLSLCCSFRMRLYCASVISPRINKNR